jgi:hypothetical protein
MKKSRQLLSLAIVAGTLLWGISVMAQGGIEGSAPNNPVLNMIGEDYSFSPVPPANNKAGIVFSASNLVFKITDQTADGKLIGEGHWSATDAENNTVEADFSVTGKVKILTTKSYAFREESDWNDDGDPIKYFRWSEKEPIPGADLTMKCTGGTAVIKGVTYPCSASFVYHIEKLPQYAKDETGIYYPSEDLAFKSSYSGKVTAVGLKNGTITFPKTNIVPEETLEEPMLPSTDWTLEYDYDPYDEEALTVPRFATGTVTVGVKSFELSGKAKTIIKRVTTTEEGESWTDEYYITSITLVSSKEEKGISLTLVENEYTGATTYSGTVCGQRVSSFNEAP